MAANSHAKSQYTPCPYHWTLLMRHEGFWRVVPFHRGRFKPLSLGTLLEEAKSALEREGKENIWKWDWALILSEPKILIWKDKFWHKPSREQFSVLSESWQYYMYCVHIRGCLGLCLSTLRRCGFCWWVAVEVRWRPASAIREES